MKSKQAPMFTQDDLERIITRRLSAQKRSYKNHDDLCRLFCAAAKFEGLFGDEKEVLDALIEKYESPPLIENRGEGGEAGTPPPLNGTENPSMEGSGSQEGEAVGTMSDREENAKYGLEQLERFRDGYPDIEPLTLILDAKFMDYAKTTKEDLSAAYEGYMKRETEQMKPLPTGDREDEEKPRGVSTGSVRSRGQASHQAYFTKDEVMAMSREQIKKNLDRVQKSMTQWSV